MKERIDLQQIKSDLEILCEDTDGRHPGSPGNRRATEYVSLRLACAGFTVTMPEFDCIDWECGSVALTAGSEPVKASISPYSLSCNIAAPLETACIIEDLMNKDFSGKIAVLHGELAKEQIMPKNFVFYNPDGHKQIVSLLEAKQPLAVIAVTGRNPELAGAQYPFPLFEDGDFNIPSVYLTEEEGQKLLTRTGETAYLSVESRRIPSRGANVIGLKEGQALRRIVLCAHLDSKKGTPGALDNATGIAALLSIADLLKDYTGKFGIEIAAFNGEDYYSQPGQMLYLAENENRFDRTILNVNIDGAGHAGCRTSFCLFNCEGEIEKAVRHTFGDTSKFIRINPWPMGDHMLFAMNRVPAVALSSEDLFEIAAEIAHTARDTIEQADINKIGEIACAAADLIGQINVRIG